VLIGISISKPLTKKFNFAALLTAVLLLAGCPHGGADFNAGKKAEAVEDYDTALIHYQQALQADPTNSEYKLKTMRLRFEAAQHHVEIGQKLKNGGDMQMALAEFQKAEMIDPASPIAKQEADNAIDALEKKQQAGAAPQPRPADRFQAPPTPLPK